MTKDEMVKFINHACLQKNQKIGNCWWVSPMSGIFAGLLMEKLLPLNQKQFENLKEKEKAFQAVFDEVQVVFKQFSEFTRVQLVDEYIDAGRPIGERDHQLIKSIIDKLNTKQWKHLFEEQNVGKVPALFNKEEFLKRVEDYKKRYNLKDDFTPEN